MTEMTETGIEDLGNGIYKKKYTNGNIYEGELKDGKFHGRGKFTWPTGQVYEGEYKDGKRDGIGKYTLTDGTVYRGNFSNGKMNGIGKITSQLVDSEGEWKDNYLYNGIVTMRFNDKTILRKIQNGSEYNFNETLSNCLHDIDNIDKEINVYYIQNYINEEKNIM